MPEITKKTFYGSGRVYSAAYIESEFPKIVDPEKPTQEEIEAVCAYIKKYLKEEYQIGYLKGGYQFNVTTNTLSDKSDLGEMKIDVISEETATVQFGLFNANAKTIADQYPTARYGYNEETEFGIATIGGLGQIDETPHVLIFKHDDNAHGDTLVIAVGINTSGFDAIWKQDSVTPFNVNYAVQPYNDIGNFAMIIDAKKGYDWKDAA